MANNSSIIPLLGWDPTNPLVAWFCDCKSDASLAGKGGVWRVGQPHSYDPVLGMARTTYVSGGSDLLFDFNGFLNYSAVLNYQLSFDVETAYITAYLPNSPYFKGIIGAGTHPLIGIFDDGFAHGNVIQFGNNGDGTTSGLIAHLGSSVGNLGKWVGGISNLNKNAMTRLIFVRCGKLFQVWVEQQDANDKRIAAILLTESGISIDPSLGFNGTWFKQTAADQPVGFRYMQMFADGGASNLTALNCHVRNMQLVLSAPTETYHPALRLIAGTGDSYGTYFSTTGNESDTTNTRSSSMGNPVAQDLSSSDTNTMVRALGKLKHETGILNHACITMHFGGNTVIKYGPYRNTPGFSNKNMTYLTTDFRTACGNGLPTKTQLIRANTTAYNIGDMVALSPSNGSVYACSAAGTSAASPPAFNTAEQSTTVDGGVTWTNVDYDMNFAESGIVRKKFTNPSVLLHMEGFNDADFIQQNLNNPAVYSIYAGYGGAYANAFLMWDALWKLWVQSLLDLYPELILILFTIPIAPNAVQLAGVVDPTGIGRVPAINMINGTYRSAPAYFQALTPTNPVVGYAGRVHCLDFARDTGITSLAISNVNPSLFPDGTHPSSKKLFDILINTIVRGLKLAMSGTKTNQIS